VSVADAVQRVAQIRTWAAPAPAATPPPPATAVDFARVLAGAAAPGTAASTVAVPASAPAPASPAGGGGDVGPDAPATLAPLIRDAAGRAGVDPALLSALVQAESGYRADAGSPAGARGLTQLMPGTARGLGVTDVLDPAQNLAGGARYLRQQLDRFGDMRLALAAYNAGPGAVTRHGGVPPYTETRAYVDRVLGLYDRNRAGTAQTETVQQT